MSRYFALLPAAGIGARMGAETPKQYLTLNNKTVIEHTLNCLLTYPLFEKIIVVLKDQDIYWPKLNFQNNPKIITTIGDSHRHLSVLNGLKALENIADKEDWILVHDAVRSCLQHTDITKLINTINTHPVGGLLGSPIHNTVKQTKENNLVHATLDRRELWQVFTPQMFRYGLLYEALQTAIKNNQTVTDESSAIELLNLQPLLIEGRRDNIKITEPADLQLAEFYLTKFN